MANFKRKYPLSRLRRLRSSQSIRDLVAENKLSIDDLIQPIFVKESIKQKEEIESLVGIFRHSEKSILKEIEELVSLGIKAVAIFPVIDEDKKDEKGSEAINENNFLSKKFDTPISFNISNGPITQLKPSLIASSISLNLSVMPGTSEDAY